MMQAIAISTSEKNSVQASMVMKARPDPLHESADIAGGLNHDVAEPEPHPGQGHGHPPRYPHGGRRRADSQRAFRAQGQGRPQIRDRQPVGRVQKAHHNTGDDAVYGRKIRRPTGQDEVDKEQQRDQRQPVLPQHHEDLGQLI